MSLDSNHFTILLFICNIELRLILILILLQFSSFFIQKAGIYNYLWYEFSIFYFIFNIGYLLLRIISLITCFVILKRYGFGDIPQECAQ